MKLCFAVSQRCQTELILMKFCRWAAKAKGGSDYYSGLHQIAPAVLNSVDTEMSSLPNLSAYKHD